MATEAAKLLARVGADLSGLRTGMQQANQIVVSGAKTLQSSASSAGAQMGSAMASSMARMLGGNLGGITSMLMPLGSAGVATVATAGLVKGFVDLSVAIDDVTQSTERSYRTFQRLAGSDAPAALEKMRAATRGAVDDIGLMSGATKFLSMNLAENMDEASRLAEIATQLGMAMSHPGGPTGAMSDFALMLANQSILRLDQFGLSSGRVRDRIEELTASNVNMNRETAFMTAVLEEADRALERVGEQAPTTAEALDTMWSNLNRNALSALGQLQVLDLGGARGTLLEFGTGVSEMFGRISESSMRFTQ
ncbi:MAG: hypothetical protein GX557_14220, partial [Chloroflexi bacterium]|nr:hypothetical protein [Chloroflexota bacterium]